MSAHQRSERTWAVPVVNGGLAYWLAGALTAAAFAATRLTALERLPLFGDEGIYLWWGEQIVGGDFSRGLGQGKPLMGWLIAAGLGIGLDPLYALRLVGVLAGALGLAALARLAARWVSVRCAMVVCALWVLLPYTLFFERVATPDQVLGSLGLAALAASWEALHSERARPGLEAAAGVALVLAALAKLPVGLLFLALPVGVAAIAPGARRPGWRRRMRRLCLLPAGLALGVAVVGGYRLAAGSQPTGFGLDELLLKTGSTAPVLGHNLGRLWAWGEAYLSWPLTLLLVGSTAAALLGRQPLLKLMAGLAVLWVAAFVPVATFWVPRYLLPVLPAAVLLTAWGATQLLDRLAALAARSWPGAGRMAMPVVYGVALVALAASLAPRDRALLLDPVSSHLPGEDREQYVEGGGAGYGLAEAAAELEARLVAEPAARVVGLRVEDDARLRYYLAPRLHRRVGQVQIIERMNQNTGQQIERVRAAAGEAGPLYVVTAAAGLWTDAWQAAFPQATLVRRFVKPGGQDAVELRLIEAQ
jgi:hypothetical protein